jgi:hypothetical protein
MTMCRSGRATHSPSYAHADSALAAALVDGQCRALYNCGHSHEAPNVVFPEL